MLYTSYMNGRKYGGKLYCFSPPVMLATFLIEFGLLFYTLWRYKLTTVTRLVAALLFFLGIFQLAEYMICGGLGLDHIEWARVGYMSITILPALGMHLVATLAKAPNAKPLIALAYGTAAAYIFYFAFVGGAVIGRECAPNYALFETHGVAGAIYMYYYYGWLLITTGLAAYWARKKPTTAPVLRWAALGYAAFIVPTTFANLIDPATIHAIPSVMCGFAILLAVILVWRVLPLAKVPVLRQPAKPVKKRA